MDNPWPFSVVSRFNRLGSIHFVLMLNNFCASCDSKNGTAIGTPSDLSPFEKMSLESIPCLSNALCSAVAPRVAPEFKLPPHKCIIFMSVAYRFTVIALV